MCTACWRSTMTARTMTWTTRLLQRPTPTTRVSSPYPWCTGAPVVCLHRCSQAYTARGLLLRGCITRRCRHDFATSIGQVVSPPPLLLPPHIIHVAWIREFRCKPNTSGASRFRCATQPDTCRTQVPNGTKCANRREPVHQHGGSNQFDRLDHAPRRRQCCGEVQW